MTNLTRTDVVPSAAQIARGKYAFELSAARTAYGTELPAAMRVAALDGTPILYGSEATLQHPANDVTMNALATLVAYQRYIDDLWWAPVTFESGGRAQKLYALRPTSAAAVMSTGGGPAIVIDQASQRPVLDFSVASLAGLTAPLDPSKVAASSVGKTLIHIGKHNSRPSGAGAMIEIRGGSGGTRLTGMGVSGTKWAVAGQRKVGTPTTAVTAMSSVDSIVGAYFMAVSRWDIANATVQMSVNGTEVIPSTAWGTGNVGEWLPASPNDARLCFLSGAYPGTGVIWGVLNTADPAIVNPIVAAIKALEPVLLP